MRGNRSNNPKAQAEKIDAFLAAYERCGMIKTAARAVGMSHGNHFHWLATVPGYAERFAATAEVAEARLGPPAVSTLYSLAVEGTMESVRDRDGNQVWDPVDEAGNIVRNGDKHKIARWVPATSRTYHVGALQFLLKSLYPDKFGEKQKFDVKAVVNHTHDVADDVKKLLADRESLDLANALARRMAVNAGGDGQSSN